MWIKNGRAAMVVEWVTLNPGHKKFEIGAACQFNHKNGLIPWMIRVGMLYKSGPERGSSYYATAEQAQREHDLNCQRFEEQSRRRAEIKCLRRLAKRRAMRHSNGSNPRETRPEQTRFKLDPGVRLLPSVKITIAPKPRDRFAPEPGFERVITADWMLRRQGVDPHDGSRSMGPAS